MLSLSSVQLLLSLASLAGDDGSDVVCFSFLTVGLFSPQDFAG